MRLYNFLNESDDNLIKAISPFLKEFGDAYRNGSFIWRGDKKLSTKSYTYKKTRKDRKPRFVKQELHEFLGKISKKLWGWNARTEGAFTGGISTANLFGDGNSYIFIPVEKYNYVWCDGKTKFEVYNLYDEFVYANQFEDMEDDDFNKSLVKLMQSDSLSVNEIKQELEKLYKKYKTSGLSNYLYKGDTQFEAIFNCNNYLMIRQDFWERKFKDKLWD